NAREKMIRAVSASAICRVPDKVRTLLVSVTCMGTCLASRLPLGFMVYWVMVRLNVLSTLLTFIMAAFFGGGGGTTHICIAYSLLFCKPAGRGNWRVPVEFCWL